MTFADDKVDVSGNQAQVSPADCRSFTSRDGSDRTMVVSRIRLGGGAQACLPPVCTSQHDFEAFRFGYDSPLTTAGEANYDSQIDLADHQVLGEDWLSDTAIGVMSDITWDGFVNLGDLQQTGGDLSWGSGSELSFEQTLNLGGFVPEPASFALISLGGLLLLRRRAL